MWAAAATVLLLTLLYLLEGGTAADGPQEEHWVKLSPGRLTVGCACQSEVGLW
jgi:hypothetical protein